MSGHGKIGFWPAVLMNINIIVGAGILFSPAPMAALAGSVSFLAWALVGLLVFPVIWCVAQAPRLFPGEGGFYNYCTKGINPTAGFVAQWAYLLGYLGTATTMLIVIREALVAKLGCTFVGEHPLLINTILIVFFTLLNMLPADKIGKIQSIATVLKMAPLLLAIGLLPFFFNSSIVYDVTQVPTLFMTLPMAIFAFWGFEACASIGGLLKDGPQSVGRVVLTAFGITVALYTLFHFSVMHIMGVDALTQFGPAVFPKYLGFAPALTQALATGILVAIVFSYMNSLFGVMLGNMSNFYLLIKNRLLIGSDVLGKTNSADRPVTAAVALAGVTWLLAFFIDTLSCAVAMTNVGVSTAFVFTLVALLLFYKKTNNIKQLLVTLLGCVSCGMLIYYSWMSIAPDAMQRLVYASPLAIGLVIGLVMKYLAPIQR
ncbi:APC family permease [Candidatus Dependentiae bacterium]|nr:APC family permease [Candidatus Dependentiae bacterium]